MMITVCCYEQWNLIIHVTGDVDEFTGERP
jgi:hypothetical protein